MVDDTIAHFPDPTIKYSEIGGDFKQKLITTFNGGTGIPDITGIKGEDIASMLPQAERFVDLKTVGADSVLGDYVEWKVKQATTLDGKGIICENHPLALGVFCDSGHDSARKAFQRAEVVLSIGNSFAQHATFNFHDRLFENRR